MPLQQRRLTTLNLQSNLLHQPVGYELEYYRLQGKSSGRLTALQQRAPS